VVHQFFAIVRWRLSGRCLGKKKSRVIATRSACLRDPVAEVMQTVSRKTQVIGLQKVQQSRLPRRQLLARRGEVGCRVSIDVDQHVIMRMREQQSGFFEAFANGSDPIAKAAPLNAQALAGFRVVNARCKRSEFRRRIRLVDSTTREHVCTTCKVREMRALCEQYFQAMRSVANKN